MFDFTNKEIPGIERLKAAFILNGTSPKLKKLNIAPDAGGKIDMLEGMSFKKRSARYSRTAEQKEEYLATAAAKRERRNKRRIEKGY